MINFNTLYLEDTLKILKQIPDNSLDMVYGDPDYNVGINYNGNKYTKSWDKYIEWYCELASESIRVLKPTGNLFLINYPKQNAYLRVKCLDNICYKVYDYVWIYNSNGLLKFYSSSNFNTLINAFCGISTLPTWRIRFLPSFCFSKSFFFRVISPP